MQRYRQALIFFLIITAFLGCRQKSREGEFVDMNSFSALKDIQGKEVIIQIIQGDQWMSSHKKGVWKVKEAPQFAVWSEDVNGIYLDTIYVTHAFAKQVWKNAPEQKEEETFRKEALPYWLHKRSDAGFSPPTRLMPMTDTVTAATPKKNMVIYAKAPDYLDEIWIMLEINLAHDGNSTYPENAGEGDPNYTGVSGQPALVYGARIDMKKTDTYEMKLLGHSSPSGRDGKLYEYLNNITTARQIIKNIFVILK